MPRNPADKPELLVVTPLQRVEEPKRPGRPRKPAENPPLPTLELNAAETALFDDFQATVLKEYPDITRLDKYILYLAAIEYIKYVRMGQDELKTGQLITMSRQHPGTQFARLIDMLSVSRKARQKAKPEPDEDDMTQNFWKPA